LNLGERKSQAAAALLHAVRQMQGVCLLAAATQTPRAFIPRLRSANLYWELL